MEYEEYKKQLKKIIQKYRNIHKDCCQEAVLNHFPNIKTLFPICSVEALKSRYGEESGGSGKKFFLKKTLLYG